MNYGGLIEIPKSLRIAQRTPGGYEKSDSFLCYSNKTELNQPPTHE